MGRHDGRDESVGAAVRLYLAGQMSGLPQFNFPAFHAAAAALRAKGYDIVSPAEMDSPAVQAAALKSIDGSLDAAGKIAGETWGEILARDVRVVADDVDGIVFLTGWHKSRGARLEAFVALLSGKELFFRYIGPLNLMYPMALDEVRTAIMRNMP